MSEVGATQAAEVWEVAKENFQPLKRGRDAQTIEQQTQMAPKAEAQMIEAQRRWVPLEG